MGMTAGSRYVPLKIALTATSLSLVNCWDSGNKHRVQAGPAAVVTRLVSEPSSDYPAVKLQVASIKVAAKDAPMAAVADGDWQVIGRPERSFDLGGGATHELGSARQVPAKRFNRISLVPGPGPQTVQLAGGGEAPLRIPAQLAKGIPVDLEAQPERQGSYDIWLVLDLARSIQRSRAAGGQTVYAPRLEPWGMRSSMIADPEGNLIEIGSWNKGLPG